MRLADLVDGLVMPFQASSKDYILEPEFAKGTTAGFVVDEMMPWLQVSAEALKAVAQAKAGDFKDIPPNPNSLRYPFREVAKVKHSFDYELRESYEVCRLPQL